MSRLPLTSPHAGLLVPGDLLETCGLELAVLFGRKLVAWRSVETVTEDGIELLLDRDSVWVWCHLLPPRLEVGQWLRFERRLSEVLIRVDLRATVRGESRLTDLFELLTAQPGSATT